MLHMVHFDSDYEMSYWLCTIVPCSTVTAIVLLHIVWTSALNRTNFHFGAIISFSECSYLIWYTCKVKHLYRLLHVWGGETYALEICLFFDLQNIIKWNIMFHIKFAVGVDGHARGGQDRQGGGCVVGAHDSCNEFIATIISWFRSIH